MEYIALAVVALSVCVFVYLSMQASQPAKRSKKLDDMKDGFYEMYGISYVDYKFSRGNDELVQSIKNTNKSSWMRGK